MKNKLFSIMDTMKKKPGSIFVGLMLLGTMTAGVAFALSQNSKNEHNTDSHMVVYYADLTHDGREEKIVVDLTNVETSVTGEEKTVRVYSGDKLIWSEHADTVHVGWNGVYLYKGDDGYYLMTWRPYASTGIFNLMYEVFSLSESGDKITLDSGELDFDIKDAEKDPTGLKQKIIAFTNKVNKYLSNSILLIDTNEGIAVYSTEDNKITRLYDTSALLSELGLTQ